MDSSKLKTGDRFSGHIAEDILVDGKPAIPKGTEVRGRVTNSETARQKGNAGLLSLVLESFALRGTNYDITTNPLTVQAPALERNLPRERADTAVTDAKNAFVPKNGVIRFYLANAVRVKG